MVATGSMDTTAKLWDIHSGHEVATLAVSHMVMTHNAPVLFFHRDTLLKLSALHLIPWENHFSLVPLIIQCQYGMSLQESECLGA